jgi:hypothetical protein
MLEESEWDALSPLLKLQAEKIKEYRSEHKVDLKTAIAKVQKPATDKYFEITGYREDNYAAILHHRLSDFGPECGQCGHLLRTPKASFCANCGLKVGLNA